MRISAGRDRLPVLVTVWNDRGARVLAGARGVPAAVDIFVPDQNATEGAHSLLVPGIGGELASVAGAARRYADELVAQLADLAPSALKGMVPGSDLHDTLVFSLTLRLTLDDLPKLLAFLRDSRTGSGRFAVLDGLLSADQLSDAAQSFTGVEREALALSSIERDRLLAAARLDGVGPPIRVPRADYVVLLGANNELPSLSVLVKRLSAEGPVVVVRKSGANADLAERALREAGAVTVVPSAMVAAAPRTEVQRVAWTTTLAQTHEAMGSVEGVRRPSLLATIVRLTRLVQSVHQMESLLRECRPIALAGALERSVHGAIATLLAEPLGLRTVSMQHGLLFPLPVGDLVRFDLQTVWSAGDASLLRTDGYAEDLKIAVVGNAYWDDLLSGLAGTQHPRDRVVVFTQPVKGALMGAASGPGLRSWLSSLLDSLPSVTLRIRVHPRDDAIPWRAFAARAEDGRVEVVAAAGRPLTEDLVCAQAAVSLFSTALADAAAAGVPAFAADIDGAAAAVQLGPDVVTCGSAEELITQIRSMPPPRHAAPAAGKFAERLAGALRGLGVGLDNSAG